MTILWQLTTLSVKDSSGQYVDEVVAGQDYRKGFALDRVDATSPAQEISIVTASAQLYRYLLPEERTGSETQVAVGEEINREESDGNNATFNVPGESFESGQQYQLVVKATDDSAREFGCTREVRVVAGP